jgi:hypothetical protein
MDTETLTVGATSGFLGSITTWIALFLKAKMTQKVDIQSQPATRLEPNPLNVKLIEEFVTKEEFRTHKDKNREQHEIFYSHVGDFVPKKDFETHSLQDRADHLEIFSTLRAHVEKDADNRAGISQQLGNIDGKLELIIATMKGHK